MRLLLLCLFVLICGCSPSPPKNPANLPTPLFEAHVAGAGRPVIFIADLSAAADVWDTTLAHLGGRVQSHVIDVAGFAGNAPGPEPLLPALADQLAVYIKKQRLSRPIVVGHMFGG